MPKRYPHGGDTAEFVGVSILHPGTACVLLKSAQHTRVTPTEALAAVIEAGKIGRFHMTAHAREEAGAAGASRYDVQNALKTAKTATHQPAKDRWRIDGGHDLDGDELTIVVALEGDVVIVTVF